MEAIAKTKYLKGSPRKARLVIDMIRGRNVSQALSILKFTDKRAAGPIAQCLNSAIANATFQAEKENIAIDPDVLWVKTCFVDMGPTKNRSRMRPAPQGRAYREQRHYCHITIQVTSEDKPKTEKELKAEAARAKSIEAKKAKKAEAPKAAKKTKADKVEEVVNPTPVETVETAPVEVVEETPTVETVETVEATDVVENTEATVETTEAAAETEGTEESEAK